MSSARSLWHAESKEQIARCHPVMSELRTHLALGEFVAQVERQLRAGYRLAAVEAEGQVVACAGYRISENLAWGRFLYVDDLVTATELRSAGHGAALLRWLAQEAHAQGCQEMHLDSGTQRTHAHRFYMREGLSISSFHFGRKL